MCQNKDQKGNMQIIVIVIIIIAVVVGIFLVKSGTNFLPSAATNYENKGTANNKAMESMPPVYSDSSAASSNQAINNNADLDKNLEDLDRTNIDGWDKELNENASDASAL